MVASLPAVRREWGVTLLEVCVHVIRSLHADLTKMDKVGGI